MVNYKSKYLEMKLKYINAKQKAGAAGNFEQEVQNAFYDEHFNNYDDIRLMSDYELKESFKSDTCYTLKDRMIALNMYEHNQKLMGTLENHMNRLNYLSQMLIEKPLSNPLNLPPHKRLDHEYGDIVLQVLETYKKARKFLVKLEKLHYTRPEKLMDQKNFFNNFFQRRHPISGERVIIFENSIRNSFPPNMNFENTDLSGFNFNHFKIRQGNFKGANLTGADFRKSEIRTSNFSNANLTGTDWEESAIHLSKFEMSIKENSNILDVLAHRHYQNPLAVSGRNVPVNFEF